MSVFSIGGIEKSGNMIGYGEFGTDRDPKVVEAKLTSQMEGAEIDLGGAAGIVLGAEVGVIVDRQTGDNKFTALEVGSVDAAGLDISLSGKRGISYANNYQNIDDVYEGLLDGGYNVRAGIVGYSQNEDGNWKGLSHEYGTQLSKVNVNYAQTTVIKGYETQNIIEKANNLSDIFGTEE